MCPLPPLPPIKQRSSPSGADFPFRAPESMRRCDTRARQLLTARPKLKWLPGNLAADTPSPRSPPPTGCAHNPTGVDPTQEQWAAIADVCAARNHLPFFDVAYQGFASGSLDADAWAPRFFAHEKGMELLVAQSYSKNLGLYGERVGALNFVLADAGAAVRALSQAKRISRAIISNPPVHGARIAAMVVGDATLFARWNEEMGAMAGRIATVRARLQAELTKAAPDRDWGFVTRQIGMFSFTGLTPAQVDRMAATHHVYMTRDGRVSLAGLPEARCGYLAAAMAEVIKSGA